MELAPTLDRWGDSPDPIVEDWDDPAAAFERAGRGVSITETVSARANPWLLIVGIPLGLYLSGLAVAVASGWGTEYLNDPVPPVFAVATFQFLEGVRKFERGFFGTVTRIRTAFDEPPERFYGFFGSLVERLYEPWPTSDTPTSWAHPTRLLYLGLVGYVVVLAVTGIGNPPHDRPLATAAFYWLMTLIGIGEVVVLAWTILITFVFMGLQANDLRIAIDPLRKHENLGLRPYGAFVVSIASRLFLALAVGGFALLTAPSPFATTLFVGGVGVFLAWFVGTQYGLHRSILRAKQRHRERVRELYKGYHPDAIDEADIEHVRHTCDAAEYARQLDRLPNWPVTWRSALQVVATVIISLVSVGSGIIDIIAHVLSG